MFGIEQVPSWVGVVGTVGVVVGILLAFAAAWLGHKLVTGIVLVGLMCSTALVWLAYQPSGIGGIQ